MDDEPDRRKDGGSRRIDYAAARVGAALALTGVLVLILIADAVSPEYEVSAIVVATILGAIAALVGVEIRGVSG